MTYRDDLGAALARVDSLKDKNKSLSLPTKEDLFELIKSSFISEPERWTRRGIGWGGFDGIYNIRRDGWIKDFNEKGEGVAFYRTGFFWIRIGKVKYIGHYSRVERFEEHNWVYVFCPRFRRLLKKHRNWQLMKNFK